MSARFRPLELRTLIAASLVLFIAVMMAIKTTVRPAQLPEGFVTPILALEFSGGPAAAQALLDSSAVRDAFKRQVQMDYSFLLAYGIFLTSAAAALLPAGALRTRAIVLAIIAAIADAVENQFLTTLLTEGVDQIQYQHLRFAVVMKFGAIAMVAITLMPVVRERGLPGRMTAFSAMALAIFTAGTFIAPPYVAEAMLVAISLHWICLCWMVIEQMRAAARG
jgi:hypothetical protein